jgi:hypothetical protein
MRDVYMVKEVLVQSALELVKPVYDFHLLDFSASDYLFASSLVAREVPELLESKMVLMYRNPFPSELGLRPQNMNTLKENMRKTSASSVDLLSHWVIVVLLAFGSLSDDIKNLVVHIFPTSFFVICGSLTSYLYSLHSAAALSAIILITILVLFVVYKIMRPLFGSEKIVDHQNSTPTFLRNFLRTTRSHDVDKKDATTALLRSVLENRKRPGSSSKSSGLFVDGSESESDDFLSSDIESDDDIRDDEDRQDDLKFEHVHGSFISSFQRKTVLDSTSARLQAIQGGVLEQDSDADLEVFSDESGDASDSSVISTDSSRSVSDSDADVDVDVDVIVRRGRSNALECSLDPSSVGNGRLVAPPSSQEVSSVPASSTSGVINFRQSEAEGKRTIRTKRVVRARKKTGARKKMAFDMFSGSKMMHDDSTCDIIGKDTTTSSPAPVTNVKSERGGSNERVAMQPRGNRLAGMMKIGKSKRPRIIPTKSNNHTQYSTRKALDALSIHSTSDNEEERPSHDAVVLRKTMSRSSSRRLSKVPSISASNDRARMLANQYKT